MSPTPEQRLAELGHELPQVVRPLASYAPTVRSGPHIYVAGQLPLVNGELPHRGKVGAEVDPETARDLAATCALNAIAAVRSELGELSQVRRIVKVVGFVASSPDFTGQPQVINGASELLGAVFGDAGVHARSAVGAAALPLDAPVEVEMIVEVV
ncbi:RidA family protein [Lipingzhangella sp. LS1_29]|uniref:RidA family protein n=1 Tax=Lipingzhangella rawalii TaxID=2055835 RepID=A0ABU2H3Y2_9ACTN|nr:RidA family protein [Lipingzhangella rawalii]MDS1270006.1 RidA family protein [Lipingzhangella rawalii]